jgi:hypothetical protein
VIPVINGMDNTVISRKHAQLEEFGIKIINNVSVLLGIIGVDIAV